MTPKISNTVGLQILVSATWHPRRDSLSPCLSGSGWCQGNGGGLSDCPIIPEWCHVVPDYTTPALYRTKEPVFLRGAASPPP